MSELDDIDLDDDDDMPTAPFWMTTFSDMATLLLTFFVLIVSMSEVEVKRFKEAMSYFEGRTSVLNFESVVQTKTSSSSNDQSSRAQATRYEELLRYLEEAGLANKVQVNLTEDGLHVTITDSVMFASGSAVLLPQAKQILNELTKVLGDHVAAVRVEGHTDDRPIQTAVYPSNWELSAARASSVVRFLLDQPHATEPESYTAIGRGQFHPLASNETASGRAQNRRVEIHFQNRHGR